MWKNKLGSLVISCIMGWKQLLFPISHNLTYTVIKLLNVINDKYICFILKMTNLAGIVQFPLLANLIELRSMHQSNLYMIIGITFLIIILLCAKKNSSVASSVYDAELPLTMRPNYLKVTEDKDDQRPIVDIETIKYRKGRTRLTIGLIERTNPQGPGLLALYADRLSTEQTIRDTRSWVQRTVVFQGVQYQALILKHRAITGSQLPAAQHSQAVQNAITSTFFDPNIGNGSWIARPFLGPSALVGTINANYRVYSAGSPVILDRENRNMFVKLASPQEVIDQ